MFTGAYRGSKIGWLLGSFICLGSAGVLIFIGRNTHSSMMLAPILFLAIIMLCARYFGVIAGIV